MIKKILVPLAAGAVAVSLCACQSNAVSGLNGNDSGLIDQNTAEKIAEAILGGSDYISSENQSSEEQASSEEETTKDFWSQIFGGVEKISDDEETTTSESTTSETTTEQTTEQTTEDLSTLDGEKEVSIGLSETNPTVDGETMGNYTGDVYLSYDIDYYQDKDTYDSGNVYGEGEDSDKHTVDEAWQNPVINITKAGTYRLSGTFNGQIRVDLGDGAKENEDAVVTLILDDADITCTVGPAILFENVYECGTVELESNSNEDAADSLEETQSGSDLTNSGENATESIFDSENETATTAGSLTSESETETAADVFGDDSENETIMETTEGTETADGQNKTSVATTFKGVDTSSAGANIIIAEGSENNIIGSHVAKIYTDEEIADGEEAETELKQDGAVYSYETMNITGENDSNSVLNVKADNEGIDTEMHLTINGGVINIESQDDGINTNADEVSCTTINGGNIVILGGLGDEGDGIDSNGWLVINGGNVIASANPKADSGLDSVNGSYINGGTVLALGSTMDWPESNSDQVTMNLQFSELQKKNAAIKVTDTKGTTVFEFDPSDNSLLKNEARQYQGAVISTEDFAVNDEYYVYIDGVQQGYTGTAILTGPTAGGPVENFNNNQQGSDDSNKEEVTTSQAGTEKTETETSQAPENSSMQPQNEGPQQGVLSIAAGWLEDFCDYFNIDLDKVKDYIEKNPLEFGSPSGEAEQSEVFEMKDKVNSFTEVKAYEETEEETTSSKEETTKGYSIFGNETKEETTSSSNSKNEEETTSKGNSFWSNIFGA